MAQERVVHTHPRDRRSYDYGKAGKSSTPRERFTAFSNEASHRPVYPPQHRSSRGRVSAAALNYLIGKHHTG